MLIKKKKKKFFCINYNTNFGPSPDPDPWTSPCVRRVGPRQKGHEFSKVVLISCFIPT